MTEKYTVGSKWNGRFSPEQELTVAGVVCVTEGSPGHPDDIIAYHPRPGVSPVRLQTAYRSRADRNWTKVEPKWEVGKRYIQSPDDRAPEEVLKVFDDGSAAVWYEDHGTPIVTRRFASERASYTEVD